MSAKRTIYIDRPDGKIPGLAAINETLMTDYGVLVSVVIDTDETDEKDRIRWVGLQLRQAKVEDGKIIPSYVIQDSREES